MVSIGMGGVSRQPSTDYRSVARARNRVNAVAPNFGPRQFPLGVLPQVLTCASVDLGLPVSLSGDAAAAGQFDFRSRDLSLTVVARQEILVESPCCYRAARVSKRSFANRGQFRAGK